jgi:VanZ family protein
MHKGFVLLFGAFLGFIILFIYWANTSHENVVFEWVESIRYGDKIGHFCLFGGLAFTANAAFRFKCISLGRFNVLLGAVGVASFAVIEELSQYFIAVRSFDLWDLLSGIVGIFVFSICSVWIKRFS